MRGVRGGWEARNSSGPGHAGPGSCFQGVNRGNDVITSVCCENQPGSWLEDGMDRERRETGKSWTKDES